MKEFKSDLFKESFNRCSGLIGNKLLQKLLKTEQFKTALNSHFINNNTLIEIKNSAEC